MNVRICQYFVGNDEKYVELCHEVEKINKKYAELHGYTYHFSYQEEYLVKHFYRACTNKEILAYKLHFIYNNLRHDEYSPVKNDVIVFIDADAAISNPNIKIENLIDDEHEIFLSRGNEIACQLIELQRIKNSITNLFSQYDVLCTKYWDEIVKQYPALYRDFEWMSVGNILFNAGFIIVKNTEMMKELFEDSLKMQYLLMDTIYESKPNDERPLGLCLLKKKYNNLYTFLDSNVQGARISGYQNKYDEDKSFILHEYGQATTKEQKIDAVKALWNNKFWKNIEKT